MNKSNLQKKNTPTKTQNINKNAPLKTKNSKNSLPKQKTKKVK